MLEPANTWYFVHVSYGSYTQDLRGRGLASPRPAGPGPRGAQRGGAARARTHTARPRCQEREKIMQDAKQDLIDRILAVRSSTNTVHIVEETLASQLSFSLTRVHWPLLMHAVFDHGNRPGGQLPIACSLATSASSPRDCACRIIFASGSSSTTASVRGTDSRASSEHDAAALTIGVDA